MAQGTMVQASPASSAWGQGARFGAVIDTRKGKVLVRWDRLGTLWMAMADLVEV